MKIKAFFALVVLAITGCAVTQVDKTSEFSQSDIDRLAAIDLTNVMVQVPRLHPKRAAPIEMIAATDGFGKQLHDVLKVAGYSVSVSDAPSDTSLRYSTSRQTSDIEAESTLYQIEVDGFRVKRSYSLQGNRVVPQSSIFVFGTDPSLINLNDDVFIKADTGG